MDPIHEFLSEEERKALELDTTDTDAKPADVVREDAAETPQPPAQAQPAAEPPPPSEEPAAAAAADGVAPAPEPVKEPEAPAPREFVPQFDVPAVDGDAATKLAELDQKLDSGEITLADYNAQRDALRQAQWEAQFTQRQNEAMAKQRWAWEVESFFDANTVYRDNKLLNAAFDQAVKDLAQKPENADKSMKWFLVEAHKQVQDVLKGAAPPAPTPPKAPAQREVPARTPPTLATVPAAGRGEASESEFSHLDGLSGEELEVEIAKMTQAQKDRYLRAA